MSRTGRKRRRPAGRALRMRAIWAGLAVVCLLVGAFVVLRTEPQPPEVPRQTWPENPYGPGDFRWQDGYMTCTGGEAALGIDVSEYQQNVDWQAVAQAGVEYVFVRIGYRGYSLGNVQADSMALQHLRDARQAGLKVGAYFYSQAVSEKEALQEAEFCLEFLDGQALELPVVFDWEYVSAEARTGDMDADTLTGCTRAFCDAIEAGGYEAMFYANVSQARDLLHLEELTDYGFWLAMYSSLMDYPYRVDVWQYTDTGSIPGISGNVDINLYFRYAEG